MTTELFMAVFHDCDRCGGTGLSDLFDRRVVQQPCPYCGGDGKRPTYIPIDELTVPGGSGPVYFGSVVDLRESIRAWLERKAKEAANVEDNNGVTSG